MNTERPIGEGLQESALEKLNSLLEAENWQDAIGLLTDLQFLSQIAKQETPYGFRTGYSINKLLQAQINRIPEEIRKENQKLTRLGGTFSACLEMYFTRGAGGLDPKATCNECHEKNIVHGDRDLGGVEDYDNYFSFCTNCYWSWHAETYNLWGSTHQIGVFDYKSNTYRDYS